METLRQLQAPASQFRDRNAGLGLPGLGQLPNDEMGVLQQIWWRCLGGRGLGRRSAPRFLRRHHRGALSFVPNNPSASVVVESFNFDAYYNDNERFTYKVSVVSGTNALSGPTTVSFLSDGTKNHPVNINYTGAPGQTLKLKLLRVASTLGAGEIEGNAYNNAVDDIAFAQKRRRQHSLPGRRLCRLRLRTTQRDSRRSPLLPTRQLSPTVLPSRRRLRSD